MTEQICVIFIGHRSINILVCLTTGSQSLPKLVLHTVRSGTCSFNLQYPLFSLRSPSSCLRLLPRLPVTPVLLPIFPPITCLKSQLLRKIWPNHLSFLVVIVRKIFLSSLTLYIFHFSHVRSIWSSQVLGYRFFFLIFIKVRVVNERRKGKCVTEHYNARDFGLRSRPRVIEWAERQRRMRIYRQRLRILKFLQRLN